MKKASNYKPTSLVGRPYAEWERIDAELKRLRSQVRRLRRRIQLARVELNDWAVRPSRRGDLRAYHLLDLRTPLPGHLQRRERT